MVWWWAWVTAEVLDAAAWRAVVMLLGRVRQRWHYTAHAYSATLHT